MVWVILLIPMCIWLGISITSHMNLITLWCVILVVAIFTFVEFVRLRKENGESRSILWSMLVILGSLIIEAFIH